MNWNVGDTSIMGMHQGVLHWLQNIVEGVDKTDITIKMVKVSNNVLKRSLVIMLTLEM